MNNFELVNNTKPFNIKTKEMDWENKIKMISLGNEREKSLIATKNYQDFVLANIDSFDGQAIDMFITNEVLIADELLKHKEFYTEVVQRFAIIMEDETICNNVSFRANIRIGVLEELIKE